LFAPSASGRLIFSAAEPFPLRPPSSVQSSSIEDVALITESSTGAPGNTAFLDAVQRSTLQPVANPRPIILIGAGGIARTAHLPAYRKASLPVAAVVDASLARASALARDFGIPYATHSLDNARRRATGDVIYDLAVPAPALLQVLRELPDGAAVLIQKPMGETLQEARAIVDLCHRKALTAAVNFQLRWAPVMLAARQIADAGLIGQLHDIEVQVSVHMPWALWSFLSTAPRLEILYHSIHYIDLVRAWLGNPTGVYARTVRSPRTPELAATKSLITFDYGEWMRVHISANHSHDFSPAMQRSYVQWEGTGGAMRAVMGVNLNYPQGEPDTLSYVTGGGEWTTLPTEGNWFPDAFIGSMSSLQSYLTGASGVLPTRVEDALDTMRVVEAAYESSEQGGVALPK
jgi:predicted dehydrogenase